MSWVPNELEAQNDCAGEDQKQFTGPLFIQSAVGNKKLRLDVDCIGLLQ
jgi:hypothetical protein